MSAKVRAGGRLRPEDFETRPPRQFSLMPLFALLIAAAVGGGLYYLLPRMGVTPSPYELVLKSSDKKLAVKGFLQPADIEPGESVPTGATIEAAQSQRSVFSYGPGSALRMGARTELKLEDQRLLGKQAAVTLYLPAGRIWLVRGPDVSWTVRTPLATVVSKGRVTEVKVSGGSTVVTAWEGAATLAPDRQGARPVTLDGGEEASISADHALEPPHPLTLAMDDPWLAWNLLETMEKKVVRKPASPATKNQ